MGKLQARLYDELKLYVRFHAWLNATPERPKDDKSTDPPLSRLQRQRRDQKDDSYLPPFPPVESAALYLLGYLWEMGPTMAGGMGPAPLTHQELRAWEELAGVELQPWESKALRKLSLDYLGELARAEKDSAASPWGGPEGDVPDEVRANVAKGLQARIRAMAG